MINLEELNKVYVPFLKAKYYTYEKIEDKIHAVE